MLHLGGVGKYVSQIWGWSVHSRESGDLHHCIWCILYTNKVIKGNAMRILPGLLGVACSPIISVSLQGMDCEPILNLAATTDEAVSIMCTVVDKTITSSFGRSWCMCAILLTGKGCLATRRCSSFNLSLGSLTWLTYAYGMLCQDGVAPGEFLLLQCAYQFFWTGPFNSCMLMMNHWLLYHQAAWKPDLVWGLDHQSFGRSWGVIWWLYCESRGRSSTHDHSQALRCLNNQ